METILTIPGLPSSEMNWMEGAFVILCILMILALAFATSERGS